MTSGDAGNQQTEDVLAGDVPITAAGPRTRMNRKRDYAAIGLIVVALVVGVVVAWRGSDLRATANTTSNQEHVVPAVPEFFPPSLGEAWRAQSGATWRPVVAGPTVVTGDGGEVVGRDPLTGEQRWSYGRDLPLCTVDAEWMKVIALHRTDGNALPDGDPRAGGGCSEMTALDAHTGVRDAQRNSDAELDARLLGDGTYLTATGERLLTSVRSDLVETMEYGRVPAMVNPNKQPRTDCVYRSVATAPNKIGVIERCPTDASARLTVYKATGDDNKADEPVVVVSVLMESENATVVAMNDTHTAVAVADPPRLMVYEDSGGQTQAHPIEIGPNDLRSDPAGRATPVVSVPGAVQWFTGSRTIVLSSAELRPLWTINDTLGPGTSFAGRALFPVKDGIAVHSQADGSLVGTIPVDRAGHTGIVTMNSLGPMVFEQRGSTLVALH